MSLVICLKDHLLSLKQLSKYIKTSNPEFPSVATEPQKNRCATSSLHPFLKMLFLPVQTKSTTFENKTIGPKTVNWQKTIWGVGNEANGISNILMCPNQSVCESSIFVIQMNSSSSTMVMADQAPSLERDPLRLLSSALCGLRFRMGPLSTSR